MVVEVVEAYARFMSLGEEKTISVTTFRKSGDGVATPTWVVPTIAGLTTLNIIVAVFGPIVQAA